MSKVCIPLPVLFNLCNKNRNIENVDEVIRGRQNISRMGYADDTTLITESGNILQTTLDVVAEAIKVKGLELNTGGTEHVTITKKANIAPCNLVRYGEQVKNDQHIQICEMHIHFI